MPGPWIAWPTHTRVRRSTTSSGSRAEDSFSAERVADRLRAGFVPVRKIGKLPARTLRVTYDLEYGSDSLEIHEDAIEQGQRVLIVDDLLATGGTARATVDLIRRTGGEVLGLVFLIELEALNGRSRLQDEAVFAVLRY